MSKQVYDIHHLQGAHSKQNNCDKHPQMMVMVMVMMIICTWKLLPILEDVLLRTIMP